jgi:hypothetical protein
MYSWSYTLLMIKNPYAERTSLKKITPNRVYLFFFIYDQGHKKGAKVEIN